MGRQTQAVPAYQAFECFRYDSAASPDLFPISRHSHYNSEILMCRSGTLRVVRGSQTHRLACGEILYVAPLVPHSVDSEDGGPVVFNVIKYSSTSLRELPSYISALRSVAMDVAQTRLPIQMDATDASAYHLNDIIEECLTEFTRREFGWELHIRALIYLLIIGLARFWVQRLRPNFTELLEKPRDPILEIPAYIEQHISEPLRVEDLAARCGMSYPWFAKRFHEYFGLSCKQLIERQRAEAVERYLLYSNLTLAEISRLTGYTDCSHMVKDFRRLMGLTPGQFRSRMKNQGSEAISPFSGQTPPNHPPKG